MFKSMALASLMSAVAGRQPGEGIHRERIMEIKRGAQADRRGLGIPVTTYTRMPRPTRWPAGVTSCREIARRTTPPGSQARRDAYAACRA
jgi:hypothetical protein